MIFFLFNLFSSKKKVQQKYGREIHPDLRIERFRMVRARKTAPKSNASQKMTPKAAAAIIRQSQNMIKDIDRLEV